MPGSVSGLELARAVRQNHPDIPILLTTGYSQKAQQAVSEGFVILPKPYDLQSLSNALRDLHCKWQCEPPSGSNSATNLVTAHV